jgi:signal transduction histidine kinase
VYREAEQHARELEAKNTELEQFHRNLEAIVEKRTAELEQANRTLAVTMQEKAETLAEMSVMQERSRIASETHDVVGHTLTAAIVQLEATKRISEQGQVPLDKLELIGTLVRKGLDDIRRAYGPMMGRSWNSGSIQQTQHIISEHLYVMTHVTSIY